MGEQYSRFLAELLLRWRADAPDLTPTSEGNHSIEIALVVISPDSWIQWYPL